MDVHDDRVVDVLHLAERAHQRRDVVAPLHIAVVQPERPEDIRLRRAARRAQPGQRAVHAAGILGDRHFVVVEDDDQVAALFDGVVQPLERDGGAERSVADHRDHVAALAGHVARLGQAAGERNGRAGMPEHELVVLAFLGVGEPGDRIVQRGIEVGRGPPGKHLVHVALMGHVEYDAVARRIEHAVQRHRGLDQAEIRPDVPAVLPAERDQRAPDFRAEPGQCVGIEGMDVGRAVNRTQDAVAHTHVLSRCSKCDILTQPHPERRASARIPPTSPYTPASSGTVRGVPRRNTAERG